MELNRAVSENIKRIRRAKKLSIDRAAALAGVSRSTLGQIERGEANPSLVILDKLAMALKVQPSVLLENDDFDSFQIARELDHLPIRADHHKVSLRQSFSYDPHTRMESFFLDLYISAVYEPALSVKDCVCHATVMSGTVEITAEDQLERLQERDAIRFAADRPYSFENISNATARLLLVYRYL